MPRRTALFCRVLLASSLLAATGCSNRDAALAEKLAAAEAAASRAEAAAERAEKAAKTAGAPPPVVMEAEPEDSADGDVIEDEPVASDMGPVPAAPGPGA